LVRVQHSSPSKLAPCRFVDCFSVGTQRRSQPGCPQAKLWLDSLAAVNIAGEDLGRIRASMERQALPLDRFCRSLPPVARIYLCRSILPLAMPRIMQMKAPHWRQTGWFCRGVGNRELAQKTVRSSSLTA
jgi:hypothetical protein